MKPCLVAGCDVFLLCVCVVLYFCKLNTLMWKMENGALLLQIHFGFCSKYLHSSKLLASKKKFVGRKTHTYVLFWRSGKGNT